MKSTSRKHTTSTSNNDITSIIKEKYVIAVDRLGTHFLPSRSRSFILLGRKQYQCTIHVVLIIFHHIQSIRCLVHSFAHFQFDFETFRYLVMACIANSIRLLSGLFTILNIIPFFSFFFLLVCFILICDQRYF